MFEEHKLPARVLDLGFPILDSEKEERFMSQYLRRDKEQPFARRGRL